MARSLRSSRLRLATKSYEFEDDEFSNQSNNDKESDDDYTPQQVRKKLRSYSQIKKTDFFQLEENPFKLKHSESKSKSRKKVILKSKKSVSLRTTKRGRKRKAYPAYKKLLPEILKHVKIFKEFHRSLIAKRSRINKSIVYKREKAEKRESERREKLRLQTLMEEDEDAYRKLIDQKKDVRLNFLLEQTDDFIKNLTGLVLKHKKEQHLKKNLVNNRKRKRTPLELEYENDLRVDVIEESTGNIIDGTEAPLASNLTAWLAEHPGWTVLPKNEIFDEEEADADNEKYEEDDYYTIAHGVREKVTKQPSILKNGKLKQYQIRGLEWMVSLYNNNLNGILADEMGLGKTIQTIALLTYLMEKKKNTGPFLIIAPLSVLSNWALEFDFWAPSVSYIVYKGLPEERSDLRAKFKKSKTNVLLTSYEFIIRDKAFLQKFLWNYMIIDEGHRLKNHNSKLTQMLNTYYSAAHRLLLTGTPLQNNLPELWTLLNFLLPSIFENCNTFEQWFNAPFAKTNEKVELNGEEKMLVIRRLHKVLRPFLLRRLKKEVEAELPDKTEYVIKCDMSSLQKVLYRHMKNKSIILTDDIGNNHKTYRGVSSLMNTIMQLRKICNHPFVFKQVEQSFSEHSGHHGQIINGPDLYRASGKFELLDRILPKFKQSGHRVLIFSQMTTVLTIMEDYLNMKDYKYLRLDGETKADERAELLSLFNRKDSEYFVFLLTTRAGGLGLNLQTADTVIIFDSDWNPHQDLQAQDRAHRIGQKNEVRVLRFIAVNSVDERMLAAAKYKLSLDEKVIQAGMFDQKSTISQRRLFLQSILEHSDQDNSDGADIPNDDEINRMIARNDKELQLFQKIDTERYLEEEASFIGPKKARLIDDCELPQWLLIEDEVLDQLTSDDIDKENLGRGNRERKQINYGEYLAGESDDEGKRKLRSKRKRDDDWFENYQVLKKKVGENGEEIPVFASKNKFQNMENILKRITMFKHDDGTGEMRQLSDTFMWLPDKNENKEYYERIGDPISIKKIQNKINHGKYSHLEDFKSDFQTMFMNAQSFYPENSQIHKDSIALEEEFINIITEVEMQIEQKKNQKNIPNNDFNNNQPIIKTSQ